MNRIYSYAAGNRLLVLTLALLTMTLGYLGYRNLPINAFPDVSPNLIQVFTETHGLSPRDVERYVTWPVEVAMNGLPRMKKIRSVSNFGLSVVNVYFHDDMEIYRARQLVGERLREAARHIPEGFGEPEMGPLSTGMGQILYYYLADTTGKRNLIQLRTIHDWLVKPRMESTPGVTESLGIGGFEKQFQVEVRPVDLLRFGVTIGEVIDKIKANNLNVGAQFIVRNSEELLVRSVGLATGRSDLAAITIKTSGGTPVLLRDLADIKIGGAIRRGLLTMNGRQEVVGGLVVKLFGANSSRVIARVERKIKRINKTLPKGVQLVPYYEQKSLVQACTSTVGRALLQGMILVCMILVLFMGSFRVTVVVAAALPFSVLFAVGGMHLVGMTANLMSLGGLAIALGMLVDGAIVMAENSDRKLRTGPADQPVGKAVVESCREVGRPILFAIAIIITVFLPLFMLQGVEGKTFRPLAYAVALAMLGSLVYALFVSPALSALLLKRRSAGASTGRPWAERVNGFLAAVYGPVVGVMIRQRWIAVAIVGLLLAVGAGVFPLLGSEFTPKLDEGTIILRTTMAPSISLEHSKRLTMEIERRLMKVPDVKAVVSRVGRGEIGAHADPVNSAEMLVVLHPRGDRTNKTHAGLVAAMRGAVGEVPGVQTNFTQPIATTVDELLEGIRAELAVKLFGEDLDLLRKRAGRVAEVLRRVRGASDVQVDQVHGTPQVVVRISREAIARYGLNVADLQQVIKAAVGGAVAGQVFQGTKRFDIFVRFPAKHRNSRRAIEGIMLNIPSGGTIPLRQVASVQEVVGVRQIRREDNQRFVAIQCNVSGRDIGSFVAEAQKRIDAMGKLPTGYRMTWGGQYRLQQEANDRLWQVIPATLVLVLLLLFTSFGNIRSAGLILLNIPPALVGGVVALWASGQNLSVPSTVGLIALFGVALENGLVLVTAANDKVGKGVSPDEASRQAATTRVRPVLMTALTTALGLLPLLIATGTGSEVQRPLATVVVGGLATSTIVTLLVLPAVYRWFAPKVAQSDEAQEGVA